ncbi:MAG: FtsX-like permease family protein [Leptonema illini]|jgi:putative ABC transport system permease protein|uniref:FtsX-like permease family protein n=1 Tax=Leptonema illini TaxID=183 RepID=A0A833GY70_9LEPT|nr:MAG: FtsX-like permease family protein [Leptonema illini]
MKTLDRKLFRDLIALRFQGLSIALVVAAGVAIFVASLSAYDSLLGARARFYTAARFAEGFVTLKRAPRSVEENLSRIPGIVAVRSRILQEAVLDLPGDNLPSAARFISITDDLNRLVLRTGRMPRNSDEVVLSESFAIANRLQPGDTLVAILNGRKKTLSVAGTALSAEYVYVFRPGSFLPDDRHYGIIWMNRDALEAAFAMQGGFNDAIFIFAPGAHRPSVLKRIDRVLDDYGGVGAYDRDRLPSHSFLRDEFKQLRMTAFMVPSIFLGVAAFLLHMVSNRLVSREREQIATLKALGYSNVDVALHYIKLISSVSGVGALIGVIVGVYLGDGWTGMYGEFYKFPDLRHVFDPMLAVYGIGIGLLASTIGVIFSVVQVIRLQPAQAMRPPVPASISFAPFERFLRGISITARLIIRHLFYRPLRTVLTVVGISFSVMIMVVGTFFQDAVDSMLRIQFDLMQRESVTISFIVPVAARSLNEITSQPGVILAEGYRLVPVRIRSGHLSKELLMQGIPEDASLRRLVNSERNVVVPPKEGVFINSIVARKFGLSEGQTIELEVLEGNRRKVRVKISGLIDEMLGQGVYMERSAVNRLLSEGPSVNLLALRTDARQEEALLQKLKGYPTVSGVTTRAGTLKVFYEMMSRSILVTAFILLVFAMIISIGVVYNTAMISLSERSFELATLRIAGFTKLEVFAILIGEITVLTVLALPLGAVFGYGMALAMINTVDTEGFSIPLEISMQTYGMAVITTILTTIVSAFILYRKIKGLDLLSVLKVRE